MNYRILKAAILTIAAVFLVSCLEEQEFVPETTYQKLLAEMAEPMESQQTKTCVDIKNPSTGFIGLMWQPEDKIGVYSQDGNSRNVMFACTEERNVPQAEFAGQMSGTPYYAYYPYSETNDNTPMNSLKGTVLAEQEYNPETGKLVCDYKYGARAEDGSNKFNFKQLFTMLRVTLDASETGLEGERLNSITLTVTDANGNKRPIAGDFTFNVTDGSWTPGSNTSGSISMPWTTRPTLAKGKTYLGFITLMPVVKKGDKISIEVISEGHKASFTADCKVEFQAGYVYDIPLTLKEFEKNSKFGYVEKVIDRPAITKFAFDVDNNSEILLNNELVWNSSKHTPSFSSVSTYEASVDNVNDEITLTIPYLYNFNLKPTFTASGKGVVVKVNGVAQESEVTKVDFTQPVVYSLTTSEGASRDYTVKINNTGLPVVIVKHSTSGSFAKKYNGGINIGSSNIGGTLVNQFVDFMIRAKDTDWVTDDHITVYNADGTLDCEVDGGVRLRGNTSQVYPKKPFAMKFNEKKSVLGMPKHKRWVLLANWLDHSMIRNAVAFDIAHAIEYAWRDNGIGEGIPWNVHGQNVELIVVDKDGDAHHVGNYLLCEQIKIDGNRLDILDPYDVEKPGADDYSQYGHLLEVDGNYDEVSQFKTNKSVPFMFKDEVTSGILNSVKSKVQSIETNIYNGDFEAAYESLDLNSVIDQWLIWELTMNREYGDPRSVYMYMNGNGKLCAGPVWDFDRGTFQNQELASSGNFDNSTSYRIKPDDEWMCWRTQENETYSYIWYKKLITDPIFQKRVQERWAVIKPYLDMIVDQIRYYGQTQAVSYMYDSKMWPTNFGDIRKYKSDFKDWSGDEELGANGNYQELINNFVTVYQERLAGMDALITGGTFTK